MSLTDRMTVFRIIDERIFNLKNFMIAIQGELTINSDMENLQNDLFMDQVPASWTKRAYPSSLGLTNWFADMMNRVGELANWTADFNVSLL